MFMGFARNNFRYFTETVWPKAVPIGLRWLVGLIEVFSIFLLRPITLAVRLFANMVAGHLMLTLLLTSGLVFILAIPDIGLKGSIGIFWFALGLFMFLLEILIGVLQAYIFTLLTAIYIDSSIHFEH
jgi:F-type H+-transporting ATPase subunit a